MDSKIDVPWNKIHRFLLECGKEQYHRDFCVRVMERIDTLVPYDQARVYFIDTNGKVYDDILFGVDKRWPKLYHEYYSRILNGRYSLLSRSPNRDCYSLYDWTTGKNDEFIRDYIKPQGIKYGIGFGFYDVRTKTRKACMFDRTCLVEYSQEETALLNIIIPHLINLHRNFYAEPPDEGIEKTIKQTIPLTTRETEITKLLSQGVRPVHIAECLFISLPTVYKHISHIHEKMDVSNRQELLVKLLNTHAADIST